MQDSDSDSLLEKFGGLGLGLESTKVRLLKLVWNQLRTSFKLVQGLELEVQKNGLVLDSFFNKILDSDSSPRQHDSDSDFDSTLMYSTIKS